VPYETAWFKTNWAPREDKPRYNRGKLKSDVPTRRSWSGLASARLSDKHATVSRACHRQRMVTLPPKYSKIITNILGDFQRQLLAEQLQ